MLAAAVAKHLAGHVDGLTYDEARPGGNVFLQSLPPDPDEAVAVAGSGGLPQPTLDASDSPTVQIRVRGPEREARPPYERARAIYAALAGLDLVTLDPGGPDEVLVISCTPLQSDPVPLGMDANQRHEWTVNAAFTVHAPTTHRPAIAG